jgi:hypothetical protein
MSGEALSRDRAPHSGDDVSRRKMFKKTLGAVAVGAVGGAVLTEITASAASAATTVESGGLAGLAPAVVHLTDAATIAVDASLGNDFRVTIAGNRTMGTPANPANGEQIIFQITQGSGAPYTIAWASGYEFSAALPQPTLSGGAGQTDLLGFVYNSTTGTWLCAAFLGGFS